MGTAEVKNWEEKRNQTAVARASKDTAERKRAMKPPERALSNEHEQYKKLKRAGLEKLIEVEKERADRQSMLRGLWRVQVTHQKKTRAVAAEKMADRSIGNCKKRPECRKLQKVKRK